MSARWTAADLPDQSGRTIIVTGATSGLGLVTARELARAGARVVLAVRNLAKGERAAATMAGRTEVRGLDLADLASVRAFATQWDEPLDVLINNAGIMRVPQGRTRDGFELQIGTNYLGPFALTSLLLPHVTSRVVTVSSQLHRRGHLDLDDLNWQHRRYKSLQAYCDSKLADLLFTFELQRRLTQAGSAVRAVAAHPGIATTSLASHNRGIGARLGRGFKHLFNDAEHGALPTLYAATQDVPGACYVGPDGLGHLRGYPKIGTPSKMARDADLARPLWDLSVRLTQPALQDNQ
ncbi:MAG: SDR family NAD(P)-dependent oxidoreductase [Actinobacteria bacterium]|nr:SDR family NAD(P)-dependent oxidoreductase [Actinomycetota bacterium]